MDRRRVGRSLHVLRRARSLRQADVAAAAGVSQPTVSAIERGRFGAMPLRTLERVFDAVEADIDLVVRHRGGEIDRLLDEGHARLVVQVARVLRAAGWQAVPEVTFNHHGDRGSIDLLAYPAAARVVLVVEVKTVVHSAEETLRRLDVKARIAPAVARERFGETSRLVVRLLAIRGSTANRERIGRLDDLFSPAFPLRGRRLVAWLRVPGPGSLDGETGALMFVPAGPTPRRPTRDRAGHVGHRSVPGATRRLGSTARSARVISRNDPELAPGPSPAAPERSDRGARRPAPGWAGQTSPPEPTPARRPGRAGSRRWRGRRSCRRPSRG